MGRGNGKGEQAARISVDDSHDLRDALAVTKGWLEILFHNWHRIPEADRFQCIAGALLGANQIGFQLELMEGHQIDLTDPPEAKMAEEFLKIAERSEQLAEGRSHPATRASATALARAPTRS